MNTCKDSRNDGLALEVGALEFPGFRIVELLPGPPRPSLRAIVLVVVLVLLVFVSCKVRFELSVGFQLQLFLW